MVTVDSYGMVNGYDYGYMFNGLRFKAWIHGYGRGLRLQRMYGMVDGKDLL